MAEEAIPSISTGAVGSRFVSQSDLEVAKARREEQWKAAYARFAFDPSKERRLEQPVLRLGQEPPPPPQEDAYDGRSLAEVCYHLIIMLRIITSIIFSLRLETCRQSRESTPSPFAPHLLRRPLGCQTRRMGGEDQTSKPISRSRRGRDHVS